MEDKERFLKEEDYVKSFPFLILEIRPNPKIEFRGFK